MLQIERLEVKVNSIIKDEGVCRKFNNN